jgi:CRP-like cAMP-binding protein
MEAHKLFKEVPLFARLKEDELREIAAISSREKAEPRAVIIRQNTMGTEVYIVATGSVEVYIEGYKEEQSLVVLGKGQVFGEMTLIDHGYRSASVRATKEGCEFYKIESEDMEALYLRNEHIGYTIMRNLATDLAFKLRHRNLAAM